VVALTLTKTGKFYLFDKQIKFIKMEMVVSSSNDFKKLGFRRATFQGFFVETLFFCLKKNKSKTDVSPKSAIPQAAKKLSRKYRIHWRFGAVSGRIKLMKTDYFFSPFPFLY
jgi:hypothetical protein